MRYSERGLLPVPFFFYNQDMIIFDTLDELESYKGAISDLNTVIEVMDHSTPYDESAGEYRNPKKDSGVHIVEAFLTSDKGFVSLCEEEKLYVEICLEGEELVNIDGSVFKLSTGRFLAYKGIKEIKRGMMFSLPIATKTVRFIF